MADEFDLAVHAFQRPIGDAQARPSQDAVEMSTQHPNQVLEGLESGAHGGMHLARSSIKKFKTKLFIVRILGIALRCIMFPCMCYFVLDMTS